ncbi:MAG TPA: AgmX/PglI C-terminal domain-containing protein [Kofleriaceae bacterium]|nr:AgmX/PglI C-terminal domain-containing protein [Kofleriaceae bacterium]
MREVRSWVVIVVALAACKGQGGTAAKGSGEIAAEGTRLEGEIPVVFGDCVPNTDTPFVSGPEPQAFTLDELKHAGNTLYVTMADGGDVHAAFDGWGTIGTGKYGTVSHGSGAGASYGIGSGRLIGQRGNGPTVTIGQPVAGGGLDKAIMRRYIKRNIQKIQYCYEKQLLATPAIAGTLTAKFTIIENGTVSKSEANGVHKEVASCVASVIKSIEFPKPKGGNVEVSYPFTFRPGGGTTAAIKPVDSTARQQAIDAARNQGVIGALGDSGGAFATLSTPRPKSKPYQPGAGSALVELRILLVDCFRNQDKNYAAVVFDLAPGAITAHGIDHPAFAKCIAGIAEQVKVGGPLRCSATFGTAGVESLPAVDITADAITMFGKKVTELAAVVGGHPEPWWKIESVSIAASEHVKATRQSKAPLTLHGPLAIRPLATTPMKVVTNVVHTLIDAGEDPLLTAQRNGTWQLLRSYALPVVPVPRGTGGSWDSEANIFADDQDAVHLSVLVDKTDVWVGISRTNEGKRVPLAKLKEELAAHKASTRFAEREDIEIAGADEVTYGQVVEAIDVASAAGFRGWSLTSPVGLSAPAR